MNNSALKSRHDFIREFLTVGALIGTSSALAGAIDLLGARSARAQSDGGSDGGTAGDGGTGFPVTGDGGSDGGDGGQGPATPGIDAGTLALVGMGASAALVKLKGLFNNPD